MIKSIKSEVINLQKELHIFLSDTCWTKGDKVCNTYNETWIALNNKENIVNTTQIHFCNSIWLVKGYRLFIHITRDEMFEIKIGTDNKRTNRGIRIAHNIEKMLLSGVFGEIGEVHRKEII